MIKKEALKILGIIAFLSIIISIASCIEEHDPIPDCPGDEVIIDGECCLDNYKDNVCDPINCGDSICSIDENCSTCWKDCGACKKIIYKYVPREYTLTELSADLNKIFDDEIKFKKDIDVSNNFSNYFYSSSKALRTWGFFLDKNYGGVFSSKKILLTNIGFEQFYIVNDSNEKLMELVNYTKWYTLHDDRIKENENYVTRVSSGSATNNYPTQPTLGDKYRRYENWKYKNHTIKEKTYVDSIVEIEPGFIEGIYASINKYNIIYQTNSYEVEAGTDQDDSVVLYDYTKVIEENFNYVQTINIGCSENLMITIYDYFYPVDEMFSEETLNAAIEKNRELLLKEAKLVKKMCEENYIDELFTY